MTQVPWHEHHNPEHSMGHVPDVLHSPVPRPRARLTTCVTAEPLVHPARGDAGCPWLTLTVLQLCLNSWGSRRPYRPRKGSRRC